MKQSSLTNSVLVSSAHWVYLDVSEAQYKRIIPSLCRLAEF